MESNISFVILLFCIIDYSERLQIIRKLIKKGADVNAAGDKGKFKSIQNHTKNEQQLAVAGFTALMTTSGIDVNIITTLIKNGAKVNATNDVGDSALNIAASNSKNEFQNMEL